MKVVSSKLSSKNQVVLPAEARRALGIKAGDSVLWQIEKGRVVLEGKQMSWSDFTSGLGKDAWTGIDTDKFIQELRDEWER